MSRKDEPFTGGQPPKGGGELDSKAFEILVRQHHRGLLAYAFSLVREEAVAEDLVQDAFLTAFQNLGRFDVRRDFGKWLRGIARMKYLELARKRRERPVGDAILDEIEREHSEWDRARFEDGVDVLAALRSCLEKLSSIARTTVDFFYGAKLTCGTIAARTDTSEAAVKKRLERSRKDLGRCIRRELGASEAEW